MHLLSNGYELLAVDMEIVRALHFINTCMHTDCIAIPLVTREDRESFFSSWFADTSGSVDCFYNHLLTIQELTDQDREELFAEFCAFASVNYYYGDPNEF